METIFRKKINQVFSTYKITIPFQIEEKSSNIFQSYAAFNKDKEIIIFRLDGLRREFLRIKRLGIDFTFKNFITFIVFHETGHALDENILYYSNEKKRIVEKLKNVRSKIELDAAIQELGKVLLESEKNAWDYVENNLETDELYFRYKNNCINSYIDYLSDLHAEMKKHVA